MWQGRRQLQQLFRSTEFASLGTITIGEFQQLGRSYVVISSTLDENSLRKFIASMLQNSNIRSRNIKIDVTGETNNKVIVMNKKFRKLPKSIINHSYKYSKREDNRTYEIISSREQNGENKYLHLETFTTSRVTGNMLFFPKPENETSMLRLMSVLITSESVRKIYTEGNRMKIGISIEKLQDVIFDNLKVEFSKTVVNDKPVVSIMIYRAIPIPGPKFS